MCICSFVRQVWHSKLATSDLAHSDPRGLELTVHQRRQLCFPSTPDRYLFRASNNIYRRVLLRGLFTSTEGWAPQEHMVRLCGRTDA